MKKNLKNTCAKTLAVVLAMGMVASVAPVSASAAKKKPALNKTKVSIAVGSSKTIKVKKNSNKISKKVAIKLTAKQKKVVSVSALKKTSFKVKGKKAGSVTLKVKITYAKKKTVTKKLKVTVTKKTTPTTNTPALTNAPTNTPPANSPGGNNPTTDTPTTDTPTTDTPTTDNPTTDNPTTDTPTTDEPVEPTKDPNAYKAEFPKITIDESNETSATKDKDTYRVDVEWDAENHSVFFTQKYDYNGGIMFALDPDDSTNGVDISEYKYVKATYKADSEVMMKLYSGATSVWTNTNGGYFEGVENVTEDVRTIYFDITEDAEFLTSVQGINVAPKTADCSIRLYDIEFVKEKENTGSGTATIALDRAAAQITTGAAAEVAATVAVENCEVEGIEWKSDRESIATVQADAADSSKATVSGVAPGSTTITATVKTNTGLAETAKIVVTVIEESVKFDGANFDLSSDSIIGYVNDYDAPDVNACKVEKTDEGIALYGNNMLYIDFSAYLAAAKINLADYSKMIITAKIFNKERDVTGNYSSNEKVTLSKFSELNGYGASLLTGQYQAFPKFELDLTGLVDGANLSDAAGININLNNLENELGSAENFSHVLVTGISLEKATVDDSGEGNGE